MRILNLEWRFSTWPAGRESLPSAAERVGPQGQVTALDLSADLLAIAAVRGKDRGLQNISFHEADAQKLPFPDQSFDLATSRFGVMFFDDIDKALRELHRVLRPGAKACFAVWDTFEQPYFQSTIGIVVRHVGEPAISPGGQNPFRFAVPGRLSSVLGNAGFSAIEEKVVTLPWPWPGPPEELWEQTKAVSAPFRSLLDRVPTQKWPEINAEVIAAIRTYADNDCIRFEVTVRMVSGTKHSR